MNIKDNYKYLTFSDVSNFDLDSFQEKTTGNDENPNPNQNPTNPPISGDRKPSPTKGDKNKNNGLIIGGVITIFVVLVLIIGFFWARKKK